MPQFCPNYVPTMPQLCQKMPNVLFKLCPKCARTIAVTTIQLCLNYVKNYAPTMPFALIRLKLCPNYVQLSDYAHVCPIVPTMPQLRPNYAFCPNYASTMSQLCPNFCPYYVSTFNQITVKPCDKNTR